MLCFELLFDLIDFYEVTTPFSLKEIMSIDRAVSDTTVGYEIAESKFISDPGTISLVEMGVNCHLLPILVRFAFCFPQEPIYRKVLYYN